MLILGRAWCRVAREGGFEWQGVAVRSAREKETRFEWNAPKQVIRGWCGIMRRRWGGA